MPTFLFDAKVTPKENIEKFLAHLDAVDHDMAALLRTNIPNLLPFPEGPDRSTRRVQFNHAIIAGLEALPDPPAEPQP